MNDRLFLNMVEVDVRIVARDTRDNSAANRLLQLADAIRDQLGRTPAPVPAAGARHAEHVS